jgi:hypothetical protein
MNWGKAIVIVLTLFGIFIISMVVMMFQQNIDLVSDDYYMQELDYQQQIDKTENLRDFEGHMVFKQEKDSLLILFPEGFVGKSVSGKVRMYRPSNAMFDYAMEFNEIDSGVLKLDISKTLKGRWELKLEFEAEGTSYYHSEKLYL